MTTRRHRWATMAALLAATPCMLGSGKSGPPMPLNAAFHASTPTGQLCVRARGAHLPATLAAALPKATECSAKAEVSTDYKAWLVTRSGRKIAFQQDDASSRATRYGTLNRGYLRGDDASPGFDGGGVSLRLRAGGKTYTVMRLANAEAGLVSLDVVEGVGGRYLGVRAELHYPQGAMCPSNTHEMLAIVDTTRDLITWRYNGYISTNASDTFNLPAGLTDATLEGNVRLKRLRTTAKSLERLRVTDFEGTSLRPLTRLKRLRTLELGISGENTPSLAPLNTLRKTLKALTIDAPALSESQIKALRKSFPAVRLTTIPSHSGPTRSKPTRFKPDLDDLKKGSTPTP